MCRLRALAAMAASMATISVMTAAWAGGGPPPPHGAAITGAGKTLVDGRGMTLYVFDRDGRYRPNCVAECAKTWKPFQGRRFYAIGEIHEGWSGGYWVIIGRGDGVDQWAYGGRPLYYYSGDLNRGDNNGDGAEDGAWHVARVLCLPLDESGEPDETGAITVVDAALEAGTSPLQELRRWCGVDLAELAERSRIEVADLLAYEAGRKQLSERETAAVANALGIPGYLLLE
jgi:predicted lipoprotein with Yx(FWY)xxD motif